MPIGVPFTTNPVSDAKPPVGKRLASDLQLVSASDKVIYWTVLSEVTDIKITDATIMLHLQSGATWCV